MTLQAWENLHPKIRSEVARHARRKEAHPDPEVAAIAVAWAEAILRRESKRSRFAALFLAGNASADVVVGELRLARRITERVPRQGHSI
jgi:hypothetical protein